MITAQQARELSIQAVEVESTLTRIEGLIKEQCNSPNTTDNRKRIPNYTLILEDCSLNQIVRDKLEALDYSVKEVTKLYGNTNRAGYQTTITWDNTNAA